MRWMCYTLLVFNIGYFVGQMLLPGYFDAPVKMSKQQVFAGKTILLASEAWDLIRNTEPVDE